MASQPVQQKLNRYPPYPFLTSKMATLLLLILFCFTSSTWASESAEPSHLAISSLLLDGAQYENRMVVVGERGHILYSEDQGHNWLQAEVPTRVMLTGTFLLNHQNIWAVGHDATIIKSNDGGKNWQLSYRAPDKETPLLDIWFKDQNNGFAIGGYGLFLETQDGGKNWTQRWISEEDDFHLNHITATEKGTLFIAAESGVVYRSTDEGASWISLVTPYPGSFFGTLSIATNQLIVFGLRGHLFISQDNGDNWNKLASQTTAMLTSAIKTKDNRCVVAGLSGVLLVDAQCNGKTLKLLQRPDRSGISALLQSNENSLILIGESGITRWQL
ncbi:FIG002465: BNR repeat protein [hydrothermal vent metagenome]|uniref:FIG002465: BNR repeat protein n=1 Tax=hydrothermal vent metagenome TaxID=652676 RepID=A0A3B0ZI95_9ZZZZ